MGALGLTIIYTATSIRSIIILKRENVFDLAYSFFTESNVTRFKMRHSTDTDSRLPIHRHNNSKAVGLTVEESPAVAGKARDAVVTYADSHFFIRHSYTCAADALFLCGSWASCLSL